MVPSPDPIDIVELEVIRGLVQQGVLVIAVGGGGIPVVRSNGGLEGGEAALDKARASALATSGMGVAVFALTPE